MAKDQFFHEVIKDGKLCAPIKVIGSQGASVTFPASPTGFLISPLPERRKRKGGKQPAFSDALKILDEHPEYSASELRDEYRRRYKGRGQKHLDSFTLEAARQAIDTHRRRATRGKRNPGR